MNHALVQCDHCNRKFHIKEIKTEKSQRLPGNITRHYFECPECHQEYTSYFLDDDMRKIQQEIRQLKSKTDLKIKQKNKLFKLARRLEYMNQQYLDAYKKLVVNSGQQT